MRRTIQYQADDGKFYDLVVNDVIDPANDLTIPEKTEYITAIDLTTCPDDNNFRTVSLGMNRSHAKSLQLLGNLSHCTEITFDPQNAQKLINWLEYIKRS